MTDQTPDEMRETAKRLRKRLETEGGTYGSRSDIRAGADALDRLAKVIEWAEDGIGLLGDGARGSLNVALALARGETNEDRREP